jgi:hypothetical protein
MGAHAPMVKNGASNACDGLTYDGCSCHNDKGTRRRGKRPAKRRDERAGQQQIKDETS